MRAVSINKLIDIPYERFSFFIFEDTEKNLVKVIAKDHEEEYLMGEFDNIEQAERNLVEMRKSYKGNCSSYKFRKNIAY